MTITVTVFVPTSSGMDAEATPLVSTVPFTVNVDPPIVVVAVTVTVPMSLATSAVYTLVPLANDGESAIGPAVPFTSRSASVASLLGTAYVVVAMVPVPMRFIAPTLTL